jgi:hypothetical protein
MDALRGAIHAYQSDQNGKTGLPAATPQETVADWVRVWLRDYASQRCTPKTIERYHQLAGYVLNATEGEPARLSGTPLARVDHVLVEAALYFMLSCGCQQSVESTCRPKPFERLQESSAFHSTRRFDLAKST